MQGGAQLRPLNFGEILDVAINVVLKNAKSVYRGQLHASLRDGVRHIPIEELERAGLLAGGQAEEAAERPVAGVAGSAELPGASARELLDRLEQQAVELAQLRDEVSELRALAEQRAALEAELREARARIAKLERAPDTTERPRIFKRRRAGNPPPAPPEQPSPPAAPADPSLVDLNSASADELTRLPGIGVKAAARIVEHRQRNGQYPSVNALRTVEGFDVHRVRRIAPHVRV